MVSSDEDEHVASNANNSSNANHLRHETEDDGQFPFRRTNANQYHRVCALIAQRLYNNTVPSFGIFLFF